MASPLDPEKVARIEPVSIARRLFRLVPERYREEALSTVGSLQYGGRYNPPREFGVLYLGEDEEVCWAELRRRAGETEFLREPQVFAEVGVELERVLDLTDEEVLRELGIEEEELLKATGDEAEDYRLTREIARTARAAGFEALKVRSVTSRGSNLVVFTDKLSGSSRVELLELRPASWDSRAL